MPQLVMAPFAQDFLDALGFLRSSPIRQHVRKGRGLHGGTAMVSTCTEIGGFPKLFVDFPYDDHLTGGYFGLFVVPINVSKMPPALPKLV